jgi:hypothetical protein
VIDLELFIVVQRRSSSWVPTKCLAHTYDATMTIVTCRPRECPAKPARAAEIKLPRIVQHTPRGRVWKLPPPDPEAEARAPRSSRRAAGRRLRKLARASGAPRLTLREREKTPCGGTPACSASVYLAGWVAGAAGLELAKQGD